MTKQEIAKLLEEKVIKNADKIYDYDCSYYFEQGADLFLPLLAEAIDMLRCTYVSMASTVGFIQVHSDNCRKCQLIQKIKEM